MSIQTRSTATLVARLQELRGEEEEIVAELRQRAVGNNEQERKHCDAGTPGEARPKTMKARPKTMKNTMENKASRTSSARVTFADVVRRGKANKSPTNEPRAHSLETIKPVN